MKRVLRIGLRAIAATIAWTFLVSQAAAIETYIFRGAGDFSFIAKRLTFSEGMDTLADKITAAGMHAKVYRWEAGEFAYREIRRRQPEAVALIGHSMGALTALAIAGRLKNSGIRVAYLGTIDIPGPVGATPSNVENAENFFHAFPVFGQLTKGPGYKGKIRNHMVWGQIHITMDNSSKVHNAMLASISDARPGNAEVMQAYAEEDESEGGVLENIDRVLTASTSRAPDAGELSSGRQPPPFADPAGEERAAETLALLGADAIPVPVPRPNGGDTVQGLPLIR